MNDEMLPLGKHLVWENGFYIPVFNTLEKTDDLDLNLNPMAMNFISVALIVVVLPLALPRWSLKPASSIPAI